MELLKPADIQMAEDFLNRQRQLHNPHPLAEKLLARLFSQMGLPARRYDPYETIRLMTSIVRASKGKIRTDEDSELP